MKIKKFSGNKRSLKLQVNKLINNIITDTIFKDGTTDLDGYLYDNEYFWIINENELSMMSYEDFSRRIDAFKDYLKDELYYNEINWGSAYLSGSECNSFEITNISIDAPTNESDTNGEITVTVSNGVAPYEFSIYSNTNYVNENLNVNSNSFTFIDLTGNTEYYVYVVDSNGCFNMTEDFKVPFGCGGFNIQGYSFPPTNQTNDNGEATIYLYDRDVSKTVYYEWRTGSSTNPTIIGSGNMINGNSFTITNLHQNTTYYVTVTANTSCVVNTQIDVGDTDTSEESKCNNKSLDIIGETGSGIRTVIIVGGSKPYNQIILESGYTGGDWVEIESESVWESDSYTAQTSLPINPNGIHYRFVVTDADGCMLTEEFIITDGNTYETWPGARVIYNSMIESSNNWTPYNGQEYFLYTKNTSFYNSNNDMGLAYEQFYIYQNGVHSKFNPVNGGYVSLNVLRDGVSMVYTYNIGSDGKILNQNPSLSRPASEYVLEQTIDMEPTTNSSTDGKATVKIYNGTSNYNYTWKIEDTSTNAQITTNSSMNTNTCQSLQRGVNYYVTATDSSSPVKTFKTKVYFNPISNYLSLENIEAINSTDNLNNGRIIVTLKNGTPPYAYNVNNGLIVGSTSTTIFTLNQLEGNKVYTIDITDNNDTTIQAQIEVKKDTYTIWFSNSSLFGSESTACSAWQNQQQYYIKNYKLNQPQQSPSLGGRYLYIKNIYGEYITATFPSTGYLALRNCPLASCYGLAYEINEVGYIKGGPPAKVCSYYQ